MFGFARSGRKLRIVLFSGLSLAATMGPAAPGEGAATTDGGASTTTGVVEAAEAGTSGAPTCFDREATIVGTEESEVLVGTRGSDVIVGGGGEDVMRGLAGRDYICRGQQRHFQHTSLLIGNGGNDHLQAGGGRLRGGLGDDVLRAYRAGMAGGAGNDSLRGWGDTGSSANPGPGRDRVFIKSYGSLVYREAASSVRVNLAKGRAYGQGMDILTGSIDTVTGSEFADMLKGDENHNDLFGGGGDDIYYGRRGDDGIWDMGVDVGNDTAYGGLGDDSCQNIEHRFSCPVWQD